MLLLKLFFAFIQVGLFSVGGGYAAIPLIQEQIVNIYGLMTLEEFSDLITIAEMTPGPISINSSTFVGTRLAGPLGAIVCTLGCIIPSFIICLTLAHFYYKYRNLEGVQTVLSSLRPAVVALIGSAGVSILMLALFQADFSSFQFKDFHIIEFGLFGVSLFLLRKYKEKISAISIIFGTGILGTIIYVLKDFII
ncbi:MAG: chromate transporter [Clostridium sp.]